MTRLNTELLELPGSQQDEILERYQHDLELSQRHCSYVHFMASHYKRPNSYRSIDDPQYEPPTPGELTEVVNHLAAIHTLGTVSKMLDIYSKNDPNKTIKRWMAGTSRIPYSAWRLLLVLDGRVVQVNRITEPDGSKPWAKYYQGE